MAYLHCSQNDFGTLPEHNKIHTKKKWSILITEGNHKLMDILYLSAKLPENSFPINNNSISLYG